jgi:hypothetical protein
MIQGRFQRRRVSGNLKDIPGVRGWHIDDLIVELHQQGETIFQASARAMRIEGVNRNFFTVFAQLAETGRVPLESGETIELPRLDAAAVAAICNFELDCATDTAERVPLVDPSPTEPRIPVTELWPALKANGYPVGHAHLASRDASRPLSQLAEETGLNYTLLHRISRGRQNTVAAGAAITLLMHLGYDEQARTLEDDPLGCRLVDTDGPDHDTRRLDYLGALTRFAQIARHQPWLQPAERQALEDIVWLSFELQSKSILGSTLVARLTDTDQSFRTTHQREPIAPSRRLRRGAYTMFRREASQAETAARRLAKGLHTTGPITAQAVTARTHRLRRAGALPAHSRPKRYQPTTTYWTSPGNAS